MDEKRVLINKFKEILAILPIEAKEKAKGVALFLALDEKEMWVVIETIRDMYWHIKEYRKEPTEEEINHMVDVNFKAYDSE